MTGDTGNFVEKDDVAQRNRNDEPVGPTGTDGPTSSMSRRQMLRLAGVASAGAIAGCAEGEPKTGQSTTAPPTGGQPGVTATPTLQDSVTISLGYSPNVTGDFWVNLYGINPYFTNVLEPLVLASQELRPKPWLAKSWKRTAEKTWEFTLRDGVTFHNGKEFTPEVVKFSIGEIFEGFGNARAFLQLEGADSVTVLDDTTVEFTTNTPIANYPAHIAHNMVAMQHPDADESENKPIGTGPYRLTEMKTDQFARVTAFQDYWGPEDPKVPEIVFRVIGDGNTRALSLTSHEIDLALNPPHSKVGSLRSSDETKIVTQQRPEVVLAGINSYRSPTDDVKLRRALNYAVPQQTLVETVLDNIGQPAKGPISPMIYWSAHETLPAYGPNRQKARRLVEESSYDGEPLRLILEKGSNVQGDIVAQTLQQWFSDVGVETNIQILEDATYWEEWSGGNAHMSLQDPGTFSAAADYIMYSLFHSQGQQNHKQYNSEGTGIMNPSERVDRLIVEGRNTLDEDVKVEKYGEVQQIAMDQALLVPLYYMEYIIGMYNDVDELDTHPIAQMTRWSSLKHYTDGSSG